MKVAILGDLHFGVGSSNLSQMELFLKNQERFFNDIFFPYLESNGIKDVFQLGDSLNDRKHTNTIALDYIKRFYFDRLKSYNYHTLIGNHDCALKNSTKINAISLLTESYDNINIYDSPTTIEVFGEYIDIIPWICRDNEDEILEFIKSSESEICFGHFELVGFELNKGFEMKEGMSPSILSKYKKVFSGHYHCSSNKGNVYYVGTPYQLTWIDANDIRGFNILDLNTLELEFIENPFKMFHRVVWNDNENVINPNEFSGSFVKIIVENKDNVDRYNRYIKSVESVANTLEIVETVEDIESGEIETIESVETIDIMLSYIRNINNEKVNTNKLEAIMIELYNEANEV